MPIPIRSQIQAAREGAGLFENALSMLTSAAGEPAAGMVALAELVRGGDAQAARDAVRQAFAYQPRTFEGQRQQRALGELAGMAMNSAPVKTWQRGVDIAGRYSPAAGAAMQTVPTAIGVATGTKPAMQQGRALSELAGLAQNRMVQNAMTPGAINTGPIGRQRGVFAGINALKADKVALVKAQEMTEKGVSPDEIWMKTGWALAPDGKWRFEIDDRPLQITNGHGKLSDVINHPELFDNYPDLKDVIVRDDVYSSAAYHDKGGVNTPETIGLNPSEYLDKRRLLVHELQHALQHREGFDLGASPSDFLGQGKGIVHNGRTLYGEHAYNDILGEVEARLAERRLGLLGWKDPITDYLEYYPYERASGGIDVFPEDIIVRNKK